MPASPGPAPSSMPCFPFTAARENSPFREYCRQNRSLLKVLLDTEDQSKVVLRSFGGQRGRTDLLQVFGQADAGVPDCKEMEWWSKRAWKY